MGCGVGGLVCIGAPWVNGQRLLLQLHFVLVMSPANQNERTMKKRVMEAMNQLYANTVKLCLGLNPNTGH